MVAAPEKKDAAAAEGAALVEVGPRACLMPIRIFAGSFGGPVLYENPAYVSPNKARARAGGGPARFAVRTGGAPSPVTGDAPAQGLAGAAVRVRHACCTPPPGTAVRWPGAAVSGARRASKRRRHSDDQTRPQLRQVAPRASVARCSCARGPAQVRAALKRARAGKYGARVEARGRRREHVAEHQAPRDALADVFR